MRQNKQMFGMRQHFGNVAELMTQATVLDRAQKIPLICDLREVPGAAQSAAIAEHKHGVWNINQGELAAVVSDGYNILQHEDFVKTVATTLMNLGVEIKGNVINRHSKIMANILVPKEVEVAGEKFFLGFRISNSFDKTTGIRGEFYGVRLACQNGMLLTSFGEVTLHEAHNTTKDVEQLVMRMVKNSVEASDAFRAIVEEAMTMSLEWTMTKQILEKMLVSEKHLKMLGPLFAKYQGSKLHLSKWDVYNALTDLVTHDRTISYSAAMGLEKKAHNLLKMNPQELVALAEN